MLSTQKAVTEAADLNVAVRHAEALLTAGALQRALFNSANFSITI